MEKIEESTELELKIMFNLLTEKKNDEEMEKKKKEAERKRSYFI